MVLGHCSRSLDSGDSYGLQESPEHETLQLLLRAVANKGVCCDCLAYHLRSRQLPGCCFPAGAEATYDRSFQHFARLVTDGKI